MQPLAQTVRVAASARAITDSDNRTQTHAPVLTRLINGQPLVCDEAVWHSKRPARFAIPRQTGGICTRGRASAPQAFGPTTQPYGERSRPPRSAAVTGV